MAELDDKVIVTKDKITTIADTIREEGGTSDLMTLDEMPDNIRAIGEGGGNVDAPLFVCIYPNTVTCNLTFAKIEEIYAGTGDTKASMPQLIYKHSSSSDNGTRSVYCDVTQYDEDTFNFTFNMGYGKGVNQTQWQERIIEIQFERGDSLSKINDYTLEYQKPIVEGDGINITTQGTGINQKSQISVDSSMIMIGNASGSVASIVDGADGIPLKSCMVAIEPVQSGSGDPSPSNVRPISGWTECNITRDGENFWDEQWEVGLISSSTGQNASGNSNIRSKNHYNCRPNTTIYAQIPSPHEIRMYWYDKDKNFISSPSATQRGVYTTPSNCYYFRFVVYDSGYGTTYNNDISINYPSTDTDYHAYKGDVYNIQFPSEAGTVYGGTLDVTNGVLTVDKAYTKLDGTQTIANSSFATGGYVLYSGSTLEIPDIKQGGDIVCNAYTKTSVLGNQIQCYSSNRFLINDSRFGSTITNQTEWNEWLSNNNVQIAYEMETPQTYNLTPTEIKTLLGINNIFADCGDVDVEYVRDATSIINWLISQINLGA